MTLTEEKNQAIISKFHALLRSGKDYKAHAMYKEAGKVGFVSWIQAKRIVQNYYRGVLTDAMVEFYQENKCKMPEKIELFTVKFNVCAREARLLLGYASRKCNESKKD